MFPVGSGDCQTCSDSPICAGNAADCGGGLSAGLPLQQAGGRRPGNAIWQGIRKCNRSARAFCVGCCRGRYSADYSSSDIQHLGDAFEAETDLIPDGIKETRYESQNEFRNTGGFTYRPKMEKDVAAFLPALFITTLVLSGMAIADAQEEQSEELRGVTGASFTVNANNGYTLQPVTDEMIEEIAAIDGVESYNTSH